MVHRDAVQSETAQTGMAFLGRGDGMSALPAAAAATSSIRLGTALFGNPDSLLSLATETTNLDILSHGWLNLGLSQHGWPDEGVSEGRRSRIGVRLKETITLLNRLWSEDEVSFKGSHHHLEKASIDVRPVQEGGIPLFVAGVTSVAVNLAATLTDGWVHPSGGNPDGSARGCDYVRQGAARAGRTLTPWSWSRSSIFPSTTFVSGLKIESYRFYNRSIPATTSIVGALLAIRLSVPPSSRASWMSGSQR